MDFDFATTTVLTLQRLHQETREATQPESGLVQQASTSSGHLHHEIPERRPSRRGTDALGQALGGLDYLSSLEVLSGGVSPSNVESFF